MDFFLLKKGFFSIPFNISELYFFQGWSVLDYFTQNGGVHEIVVLHRQKVLEWETAKEVAPSLPKGWWELSQLDSSVKLEFIRDFWFNALPYLPHIYQFLDTFFSRVDDISVCLVQRRKNLSFEVFLFYKLKDCVFLGRPPLLEKEIECLKYSIDFPLPEDFLNFLRIHNGFFKGKDTGIFPSYALVEEKKKFQLKQEGLTLGKNTVDPELLFPFYQSFGSDIYQCFYKDWYPDGDVGNVFCSLLDKTISSWKEEETLSFSTFLDWLVFYLE